MNHNSLLDCSSALCHKPATCRGNAVPGLRGLSHRISCGVKHCLAIIAILFGTAFSSAAQYRTDYVELDDSETVRALKSHIRYLASDALEGRKAGSEGERLAAQYVAEALKEADVDILAADETFGISSGNDTIVSRNVVGFIQGYDSSLRDRYIVIGARLDNLGSDSYTLDGTSVSRVYNGANGNASGLAMMIELAKKLQTNSVLLRRSVLLVAFGASCQSFAGSWYFLNRSFGDVALIDAMVNLDCLGCVSNGFYAYTASNTDMNAVLSAVSGQLQPVKPELTAAEVYPSDNRAFYAAEIPSVTFSTGKYPEHNTERDKESIIDYDGMERELEYIYNFCVELAATDGQLSFRPSSLPKRSPSFDDVIPYYECDTRPMFLNSTDIRQFLEKWVYQYLKYPKSAVRDGIQGKVLVDFVIGADGKVTDARVIKGVSEELDAEALKVVSASPKWRPARMNGKKVRCSVTIPVEFRLEKKGGFGINNRRIK